MDNEAEIRKRKIYRVTFIGFVVNLALSCFKLAAGVLGRSAAMTADAVHSFSDMATDVVVIAFARISAKPKDDLKKGAITTKVAMDKLKPFTKKIPETEKAEFNGGAKFCNGDTVMARITPCLENGKTAYVDMLDDGEIGFGSTEFIVMRAKAGISDPQFVYYTAINPTFRNVAIKSMVGSSGRQRIQQSVLEELELSVPGLDEQRRIGAFLAELDEKIALNNKINDNLLQQAQTLFADAFPYTPDDELPVGWRKGTVGDIVDIHDSKRIPLSGAQRDKMTKRTYYGCSACRETAQKSKVTGRFLFRRICSVIGCMGGFHRWTSEN